MKRNNVWSLALALPMVIGILLLAIPHAIRAATESAAPAAAVKIDNFSFTPPTLTVVAGTTVTWTNRDDIPHTVVSSDGLFKSKVRDTDETFTFTFAKAGTYGYFCSLHPKMIGKIVVQ
jgi:plastocyanin